MPLKILIALAIFSVPAWTDMTEQSLMHNARSKITERITESKKAFLDPPFQMKVPNLAI